MHGQQNVKKRTMKSCTRLTHDMCCEVKRITHKFKGHTIQHKGSTVQLCVITCKYKIGTAQAHIRWYDIKARSVNAVVFGISR